jgi:hypothetical protein
MRRRRALRACRLPRWAMRSWRAVRRHPALVPLRAVRRPATLEPLSARQLALLRSLVPLDD